MKKLVYLNAIFAVCLVIANVVSCKVVNLFGLTVPAAVVVYPWTFLCTDIIGQIYGEKEANKTVRLGIFMQIISLLLILATVKLPIAPYMAEFQKTFEAVFGGSLRIVIASLAAYVASQSWDVMIFHKIKNWHTKKTGDKQKGRWIWNNASTMTSQALDTVMFITIAFFGVVPNLGFMVLSQYIIKLIIAVCDTPIFYAATAQQRGSESHESGQL